MVSRHWEEKQNNTLNESNTIHTAAVHCPQTLWAPCPLQCRDTAASHAVPSPLPLHAELRTLELLVWQARGSQSSRLSPPTLALSPVAEGAQADAG